MINPSNVGALVGAISSIHDFKVQHHALAPPSSAGLARLSAIHLATLEYPQTPIATEHMLHGGMYARTIRLEPDTLMNGSLIKAPTILIVDGVCLVHTGDQVIQLDGYNVLPGLAGRKLTFVTRSAVTMTMIYATQATNVADAEEEVFGEVDELMSRKDGSGDTVVITGE